MVQYWLYLPLLVGVVFGYPYLYETTMFRVGIEYDNSLPMNGGSDRYRHRNNYDPFFVTVSATAKSGFVIAYLEVSATVDAAGEVDFTVVRGQTGAKTITFQLVSNHSDFLSYNYLAYGIREEEYKKISNVITLPINDGFRFQYNSLIIFACLLAYALSLLTSNYLVCN